MDRTAVLILPGTPTKEDIMDYILETLGQISIETAVKDEATMFNVAISVTQTHVQLESNEQGIATDGIN